VQIRSVLLKIVGVLSLLVVAFLPSQQSFAAQSSAVPAWLAAHIGYGDGQIAPVVLQRARALYFQKVGEGAVRNPCYFAMDATRPGDMGGGRLGRRFYVICEAEHAFRAIPAGHGAGRDLKGVVNFSNGRQCARNFGNAMDSELTTGGAYVTAETKTSYKGYYRVSAGRDAAFMRSFVQFDGEGEAANARRRAIGGHPAVVLRGMCRMRSPGNPYAKDGYVVLGKLVDYSAGRSNGCTSWSPSDARQLIPMIQNNPTTLYIYPESRDIAAVDRAVAAGQSLAGGPYWDASCLKQIGAPKFWRTGTLEPVIAQYRRDHPAPHWKPLPICEGQ